MRLKWPYVVNLFLVVGVSILLLAPALRSVADESQVVKIDPTITHGIWEGWGISLCWEGKVFGDRDDLADLLFTTRQVPLLGQSLPGLGLNIVRYNAGACSWNEVDGHKMVRSQIIPSFRQMEGFWLDGKSNDPASPSWDWTVDANQRFMLAKARDRGATRFELFSNSPMWWMCANDNPSGAAEAKDNNLAPGYKEEFATYLATIARHARDKWGITFTSVEPFNEPVTSYWSANGKQEGCHFSREMQAAVLPLLRMELDRLGLKDIPITASDETAYDDALATWNTFSPDIKACVMKVNVHGYQRESGQRDLLQAAVAKDGKQLWNSEYGEDDGSGLSLARCLNLDFRYLHPTAWCYWQSFDGGGWALIQADLTTKTLQSINPKYFVLAQYTRHIRPGMTILETGDDDTVAAYDATAHKLILVLRTEKMNKKTIDLEKFLPGGGPVTRWVTEPKKTACYQLRRDLTLSGKQLTLDLPENSVQTVEIENVRLP